MPAAGRKRHDPAIHVPSGLCAAAQSPGRRPLALRPHGERPRVLLSGPTARRLARPGAMQRALHLRGGCELRCNSQVWTALTLGLSVRVCA